MYSIHQSKAKLAGLPPRENGRCERAVGDSEALDSEWRPWVGEVSVTLSTPIGAHRLVARCQSETTLQFATCNRQPAAVASVPFAFRSPEVCYTSHSMVSGLRRIVTVSETGSAALGTYQETCFKLALSDVVTEPWQSAYCAIQREYGLHVLTIQCAPRSLPSLPISTPSLAYSPMSTATTALFNDGERIVYFTSFVNAPSLARYPGELFGNTTGPTSGHSHPL